MRELMGTRVSLYREGSHPSSKRTTGIKTKPIGEMSVSDFTVLSVQFLWPQPVEPTVKFN